MSGPLPQASLHVLRRIAAEAVLRISVNPGPRQALLKRRLVRAELRERPGTHGGVCRMEFLVATERGKRLLAEMGESGQGQNFSASNGAGLMDISLDSGRHGMQQTR